MAKEWGTCAAAIFLFLFGAILVLSVFDRYLTIFALVICTTGYAC